MTMPLDEFLKIIRTHFYHEIDKLTFQDTITKHYTKIIFEQAVGKGVIAYTNFLQEKWKGKKHDNLPG